MKKKASRTTLFLTYIKNSIVIIFIVAFLYYIIIFFATTKPETKPEDDAYRQYMESLKEVPIRLQKIENLEKQISYLKDKISLRKNIENQKDALLEDLNMKNLSEQLRKVQLEQLEEEIRKNEEKIALNTKLLMNLEEDVIRLRLTVEAKQKEADKQRKEIENNEISIESLTKQVVDFRYGLDLKSTTNAQNNRYVENQFFEKLPSSSVYCDGPRDER
jgi:chromosome segregation ATPase